MDIKAENSKFELSWSTVFISFIAALAILVLLLEAVSFFFPAKSKLHSVEIPLQNVIAVDNIEVEQEPIEQVQESLDIPKENIQQTVETTRQSPFQENMIDSPQITQKTRGVIAVIVKDFGLSYAQSQSIVDELPPYTTLALSPYTRNKSNAFALVQGKNMELWGQFDNQESLNTALSGSLSLSKNLSMEVREGRVQNYLKFSSDLTGFISQDELGLQNLISSQGLAYYNLSGSNTPVLKFDRFSQILRDKDKLRLFLKTVFDSSVGIIIVEPSPNTIKQLPGLLDSFTKAGLQIVPLSYFVDA